MERTFSPMVRQFSAIAGLQQAYTWFTPLTRTAKPAVA